jgi:hypothetical protein
MVKKSKHERKLPCTHNYNSAALEVHVTIVPRVQNIVFMCVEFQFPEFQIRAKSSVSLEFQKPKGSDSYTEL